MRPISKSTRLKNIRVAIAHDYLRTYGGGEKVLEELHKIFPKAPIFLASIDHKRMGAFIKNFDTATLITSWVQKIPILRSFPLLYRPILPLVWKSFDTKEYDLIISSSGSNISKSIPVSGKTKHLCYCHTPPRFIYGWSTETGLNGTIFEPLLKIVSLYLKRYDIHSNTKVDLFLANSKNVSERIKKVYKRDSKVVYPPCSIQNKPSKNGEYFLVVSRLVKYKNIDLIINAFKNTDFRLKIVGDGTEKENLHNLAKGSRNIEFLGEVDDNSLKKAYQKSKALVVATSDEDFGMTIAEAAGFGKPAIAYFSGGHRETVVEGKTGVFFYELSPEAIQKALNLFTVTKFDYKYIWRFSQKFSKRVFDKNIKLYADRVLQ